VGPTICKQLLAGVIVLWMGGPATHVTCTGEGVTGDPGCMLDVRNHVAENLEIIEDRWLHDLRRTLTEPEGDTVAAGCSKWPGAEYVFRDVV
jgi:hypothetical protein